MKHTIEVTSVVDTYVANRSLRCVLSSCLHVLIHQAALNEAVDGAPHKFLLFIDTNIALHQIDILEYKCPATSLIVILQTVLQELQHLNLAVYRRLLALMKDETRCYIFYPNEISTDTQTARYIPLSTCVISRVIE